MKPNVTSIIITCFVTAMVLVSCESHEKPADDAFERVKEEKMISNDSDIVSKEIIQEPKKTKLVKKNASPDEWAKFKTETEKKIASNENKIKEIKGIPNANAKLLRKVTILEKENNDLRRQMDEYKEEVKVKWESFKQTINHDVNEIDIELKDITINNKK